MEDLISDVLTELRETHNAIVKAKEWLASTTVEGDKQVLPIAIAELEKKWNRLVPSLSTAN